MDTIWNPEFESMERGALRDLQLLRLSAALRWAYDRVPFYREHWGSLRPSDVKHLDDLAKLPLTAKEHFQKAHPFGLFAVPLSEVARIHSSTGTKTTPRVAGYTRADLAMWAEVCARIAVAGGVQAGDMAQVAFGYGMPTGAFGMHSGLELVGATVIPASTGNTLRQLAIMRDYGTAVLVCTPSYALFIAESAAELGFDFGQLALRVGLFGAEPWTSNVRDELEARMGIQATDNYGLSEVIGPGVSGECSQKNGLHINEDHFLVEVVDPATGAPLPEGQEGELVFTSLTKEAVPVIRYRTGDLGRVTSEPCACGRTFARHSRVFARTDDMMIVRGINVFPAQVEAVLMAIEGVAPHYRIILDRKGPLDEMEVQVELEPSHYQDVQRRLVEFERHVEDKLQEELMVRARVKLVEPKTVPRSTGKARHVVDRRV